MKTTLASLFAALLIATPAAWAQDTWNVGERLAAPSSSSSPSPSRGKAGYREIDFYALSPKGWNPMAGFDQNAIARMRDNDPRATAMLQKMREAWNNAPVVPALNRQRVRLAGFIVPLDAEGGMMREFLLVPYFGACIHVPPPPPNQVVHVTMEKPFPARMMDPFWISGEMNIARSELPLGTAAYKLRGVRAEPYRQAGTPWQ